MNAPTVKPYLNLNPVIAVFTVVMDLILAHRFKVTTAVINRNLQYILTNNNYNNNKHLSKFCN